MEEIEYLDKLKNIEKVAEKQKADLMIEFAMSNAKFKKGDIVKNHNYIILVDKITVSKVFMGSLPKAIYHGVALKKDLTPRKDGSRETIYYEGELVNP